MVYTTICGCLAHLSWTRGALLMGAKRPAYGRLTSRSWTAGAPEMDGMASMGASCFCSRRDAGP